MLGGLVHLVDRVVDLREPGGLLLGRGGDLGDDAVDGLHLGGDLLQGLAGRADQLDAGLHLAGGIANGILISLAASAERWARARTSWATTAKPRPLSPARAASTPAFRARRLVWKAISSMTPMIWATWRDEASMPLIAWTADSTTSRERPASTWASRTARWAFLGAVGRAADGGGDLVERGGGLLQAGGLLLAAARQVVGGRGDAVGPRVQARDSDDDRAHGLFQMLDGLVEVGAQALVVGGEGFGQAHGQVAGRQPVQAVGQARDHQGLLLGLLAVAVGRQAALGLGGLAMAFGLGLDPTLLAGLVAEGVDRVGHQADVVAAAGERQGHREVAAHHPLHGFAQVAQRGQLLTDH